MLRFFRKKERPGASGTIVVGCGGGGCNIVNRLAGISAVDILTINTDRKGLVRSRSNRRILLGDGTINEGCGGDVGKGMSLAKDAAEMIDEHIRGHMNVVIAAGLGGGTGTGSAAVIAEMAKSNGSRVIMLVSIPMSFESGRRRIATDALADLKGKYDILIVADGDRLAEIDPLLGAREAFSVLDQMMCESFTGLMEMLEGDDGESVYRKMKGGTFTVSFAEGMIIEKVAAALVHGLMLNAAIISEPLIFIRGNIPSGHETPISKKVLETTGRTPVFIQGPEGRGMNMVMFAEIQ
ncbi:MAG: hypothetical protein FWD92_04585 [Methanomassiliicoccaceae archaeon]|nr:hypothetical protein [Methanomassiliicoccaceae archaeon]